MNSSLLYAARAPDSTRGLTGNLKGIIIQRTGRTIWVCHECYDTMLMGKPITTRQITSLDDYSLLTTKNTEFNVTLTCSASLIIFTKTLFRSRDTKKVIIRIDPAYFETLERTHGAQFNAISNQFNDLGEALSKMSLSSFELYGNITNGKMYAGLKDDLKCRTLQRLVICGAPLFLQSRDISNNYRRLTQLVLDDVRIDTTAAANNLQKLLSCNTVLSSLQYHMHVSRCLL